MHMSAPKQQKNISEFERLGKRTYIVEGESPCSFNNHLLKVSNEWQRNELVKLRQLLCECAFDFEECVENNQLVYRKGGEIAFRIFMTSGYVWLTLKCSVDLSFMTQKKLAHLVTNRRSLRLNPHENVDEALIREFVYKSVDSWRRKESGISK